MNKKEVSEIKKNFKEESGFFTLNRILTAFVDAESNILCHKVHATSTMTVEDRDVYDETLKKVLSTSVGKKFIEYAFPDEAYHEGHAQNILYKLLSSELKDDAICTDYLNHIANNMDYTGPYTIITAYCTYSVRKKNKNDEIDEFNDEVYNYILTAICPASTSSDGFVFDREDNDIIKKLNTELIIDKSPTDGFLFPSFSNRSSDINHIMYYTSSSKKPNYTLVENVLECEFELTADLEKNSFMAIMSEVAGDDLNYTYINAVNEKLKDIVMDNRDSTDIPTVEPCELKEIFRECGLSDERAKLTEPMYKKFCGDYALTASNLIDNKNVISTTGIKLEIQSSASEKVRTAIVDGHRCLLIDIDDPKIEINGLAVDVN